MQKNQRIYVLICIFFASVAVRLLTAEYMENGGDCSGLWLDARMLAGGESLHAWSHHNMRWATLLPLVGFLKIFGTHPVLYYVVPILFASISSVLICFIGERLHSLKLGCAAAILFILYPQMTQTGSQIWPSVFEITYILLCTLLLLVWLEKRSWAYLAYAACAFFLGWASRVSAIYFLPGLLLLVWLPTRNFRAVFTFCLFFGALCSAELVWFWLDSGNPLGRIGLLSATHVSKAELLITPKEYLLQFLNLVKLKGLLVAVVAIVVACIALLRSSDQRLKAFACIYLFHLFLEIWMLASFSPLKIAQPIGARYNCASIGIGVLVLCVALWRLEVKRARAAKTVFMLIAVAFIIFSAKKIPSTNSLLQTVKDYQIVSNAFANDIPILMRFQPWSPNFIEAQFIAFFGGKTRRKELSETESNRVMIKNSNRMASLYGSVEKGSEIRCNSPVKLNNYLYLLDPSMEQPYQTCTTIVVVDFGRKHCKASFIPKTEIISNSYLSN